MHAKSAAALTPLAQFHASRQLNTVRVADSEGVFLQDGHSGVAGHAGHVLGGPLQQRHLLQGTPGEGPTPARAPAHGRGAATYDAHGADFTQVCDP